MRFATLSDQQLRQRARELAAQTEQQWQAGGGKEHLAIIVELERRAKEFDTANKVNNYQGGDDY